MDLRLIGVILIIIGCGALGFKFAADFRSEMHAIRDLINILDDMECELNYRLTPLPQLCRLSSERGKSLKCVFICFAEELENQISPDTASCMKAALSRNSALFDSVRSHLWELGCSFGKFDLEGQINGIKSVRQKCMKSLDELEKNKDIRIRNYQTLGLCAGAAVAILLF